MSATSEQCKRADELCAAIYERNPVGCCWHIVLDDFNLRDSDVEFCVDHAGHSGHTDCGPECVELGPIMRAMTVEQRRAVRCRRNPDRSLAHPDNSWTLGDELNFESGLGPPKRGGQ